MVSQDTEERSPLPQEVRGLVRGVKQPLENMFFSGQAKRWVGRLDEHFASYMQDLASSRSLIYPTRVRWLVAVPNAQRGAWPCPWQAGTGRAKAGKAEMLSWVSPQTLASGGLRHSQDSQQWE